MWVSQVVMVLAGCSILGPDPTTTNASRIVELGALEYLIAE